ncbi:hypothetical protein OCOJLMKI_3057 [Methylobacterium iners]|uniref:Uncharacterized protein n=2 Tax=Methylobacterium iners TaxID=418707 RepID=A0ABQ4RYC3_9HYPH|nr:hypothetical protein OCOJLMKI_3057 [Methylobacterium iners]
MQDAEPCLQALRELANRSDATEDEIDAVLHSFLCTQLNDVARFAVVEYVSDEVHFELIRQPAQHAFWQRVVVVALDKFRIMTDELSSGSWKPAIAAN